MSAERFVSGVTHDEDVERRIIPLPSGFQAEVDKRVCDVAQRLLAQIKYQKNSQENNSRCIREALQKGLSSSISEQKGERHLSLTDLEKNSKKLMNTAILDLLAKFPFNTFPRGTTNDQIFHHIVRSLSQSVRLLDIESMI